MKVEQKGSTIIIKDTQGDFLLFAEKLNHEFLTFSKHNVIIDLSLYQSIPTENLKKIEEFSKKIKKLKKSFILVIPEFDFNKNTKFTIVPSVLEAHDMIELDEIERDLGF